MRSLFRRIKRNGVAMSTLRILGTALFSRSAHSQSNPRAPRSRPL